MCRQFVVRVWRVICLTAMLVLSETLKEILTVQIVDKIGESPRYISPGGDVSEAPAANLGLCGCLAGGHVEAVTLYVQGTDFLEC
jgi:hypothetical protein